MHRRPRTISSPACAAERRSTLDGGSDRGGRSVSTGQPERARGRTEAPASEQHHDGGDLDAERQAGEWCRPGFLEVEEPLGQAHREEEANAAVEAAKPMPTMAAHTRRTAMTRRSPRPALRWTGPGTRARWSRCGGSRRSRPRGGSGCRPTTGSGDRRPRRPRWLPWRRPATDLPARSRASREDLSWIPHDAAAVRCDTVTMLPSPSYTERRGPPD